MVKGRKFRNYLIDPKFQLSFVGLFVAITIGVILLFYFSNLYMFDRYAAHALEMGFTADHPIFDFLDEQHRIMNNVFLATSFLALILLIFAGIVLSHRVAGPIFRLRTQLDKMAGKRALDTVFFRKGDFFHDVATSFNQVVERFSEPQNPE